jgi:hypothetical protein
MAPVCGPFGRNKIDAGVDWKRKCAASSCSRPAKWENPTLLT